MAVRIRKNGQILCAAMHPAEPGDTYVDDVLHEQLASGTGALVTEPMHCDGGRRGHAHNSCTEGNNIESYNKVSGTGGHPLCSNCKTL